MKRDNFTIISCYTDTYTTDAELLKKSLKQFNLNNTQIEKYNNKGKNTELNRQNWKANLKQKPIFIKQKLEELKSPVVWTDADSILLQYPELLNTLDCDIAIWRPWCGIETGGTMYFNYSDGAFAILNDWINTYRDTATDGRNLTRTLRKLNPTFIDPVRPEDARKIAKTLRQVVNDYGLGEGFDSKIDGIIEDLKNISTKKDEVKIFNLPFTYNYFHIDDSLYSRLLNNEPVPNLNDLNIVFAHTRGYYRYFNSKRLKRNT